MFVLKMPLFFIGKSLSFPELQQTVQFNLMTSEKITLAMSSYGNNPTPKRFDITKSIAYTQTNTVNRNYMGTKKLICISFFHV